MTEIETLKSAFNATLFPVTVSGLDHCSALIKLLPGYKDLLVSHVTWTGLVGSFYLHVIVLTF